MYYFCGTRHDKLCVPYAFYQAWRPLYERKTGKKIWEILDHIARSQNMNTSRFLTTIYDEALDINGDVSNFASLLRCSCILYLSDTEKTMDIANAQLKAAHGET
ncbi:ribbon-helix-helix domain-containing protein [Enterovibrio nigricans]